MTDPYRAPPSMQNHRPPPPGCRQDLIWICVATIIAGVVTVAAVALLLLPSLIR